MLIAKRFTASTATPTWADLVADGSVQRLTVQPEDVGLKGDGRPYMDLWFGYLNQPTLGRALLGAQVGDEVLWQRPVGDQLIEVLAIVGAVDQCLQLAFGGFEVGFQGAVSGGVNLGHQ